MADGVLDQDERASISHALTSQLDLSDEEVASIIDKAVVAHEDRIEIHSLVRAIRSETDAEDRIAIMEMAWMVVLADGQMHEYEAQLMRRLAGLLSLLRMWIPGAPPNAQEPGWTVAIGLAHPVISAIELAAQIPTPWNHDHDLYRQ